MKYHATLYGIHKNYRTKITFGVEVEYDFTNNNKQEFLDKCVIEASNSNPDYDNFVVDFVVKIQETQVEGDQSLNIFRSQNWIDTHLFS